MRHAPLIISESGCNTNTKAVSTQREKLQDKLVLDGRRSWILKKDVASPYRSACVRLSYSAQDRLDLAETAKHLAQRMSEPRELDFIPLKRAARYLVGKPKAAPRCRRQKHVDKITVFVDSDFAGDAISRKGTTGLVAQIGNHAVISGSTLQSLTALSVGEVEFYAVVTGGQVGLSLRSTYQDLSERSTLTRGTSGNKNEFKMEISVSRMCLRRKTAQMLAESQSLLQYCNNTARSQDWYSTDRGSHTPLQDDAASVESSRRRRCRTENRNTQVPEVVVNIETDVQAE